MSNYTIDLSNARSFDEAGKLLLNKIDLNNISKSSYDKFINSTLPEILSKPIQANQFTLTFLDYKIDDSGLISDTLAKQKRESRELSVIAQAQLTIKNLLKLNQSEVMPDATIRFPMLVTKLPYLSEKGTFVINGVNRVMISHLTSVDILMKEYGKGEEQFIKLKTNSGTGITITKADNYRVRLNFNKRKIAVKSKKNKNSIDTSLGHLLRELDNNYNVNISDVIGDNIKLYDAYFNVYEVNDVLNHLHRLPLTSWERYKVNSKLALENRISGKIIAEDISFTDYQSNREINIKSGDILKRDIVELISLNGIEKIKIYANEDLQESFYVFSNNFIPIDKFIKDGYLEENEIPNLYKYETEISDEIKVEKYKYVNKKELERILESRENGEDIKSLLLLNSNTILGSYITVDDIVAIINMFSLFEVGIEKADDKDSLENKVASNINTIFEEILSSHLWGGDNTSSIKSKLNVKSQSVKMNFNKSQDLASINLTNLDCTDRETITSKLTQGENIKLFQVEANLNSFDEVSHKRRITSQKVSSLGGIPSESTDATPRLTRPSQIGRICCIETPEGKPIGLVQHLALLARINEWGEIEAPYFKVDKANRVIDYSKAIYMTANEEKSFIRAIGPYISSKDEAYIRLIKKGIEVDRHYLYPNYINHDGIMILNNKEELENEALTYYEQNKDRLNADSYDLIINKKDWFRDDTVDTISDESTIGIHKGYEVDYISCRGDQVMSVTSAAIPYTSYDDGVRLLMGCQMAKQSEAILGSEKQILKTDVSSVVAKHTEGVITAPFDCIVTYADSKTIKIEDINDCNRQQIIDISRFDVSSEATCIMYDLKTRVGRFHQKGEVLADSIFTDDGEPSTGINLVVAYVEHEGLNYEDGIVLNDRLFKENLMTSYRAEKYEFEIEDKESPLTSASASEDPSFEKAFVSLENNTHVAVGKQIKKGDLIFAKIKVNSSGKRVLHREIYDKEQESIVLSAYRKVGNELSSKKDEYVIIIGTKEKISIGDKLSGRHGNKGVLTKKVPSYEMPFLEDGTIVDILLTPMGIPSRMNIGQVLECAVSDILYHIGCYGEISGAKKIDIPRLKKLVEEFYNSEDGKQLLYSGITGKPYYNKSTVGRAFIYKLKHLAAHKDHTRASGSKAEYSMMGQPYRGRQKNGGQRFGEMEILSLEAFGAKNVMREIMTYKSDDPVNRDYFNNLRDNGKLEDINIKPNSPKALRIVTNNLKGAGYNISFFDENNVEIDINKDFYFNGCEVNSDLIKKRVMNQKVLDKYNEELLSNEKYSKELKEVNNELERELMSDTENYFDFIEKDIEGDDFSSHFKNEFSELFNGNSEEECDYKINIESFMNNVINIEKPEDDENKDEEDDIDETDSLFKLDDLSNDDLNNDPFDEDNDMEYDNTEDDEEEFDMED